MVAMQIGAGKIQKEDQTARPKEAVRRVCVFCESKTKPSYLDSSALRRYLSDRSRIYSRARTGMCSKHQRWTTKQIKYARHLALLPFVSKV